MAVDHIILELVVTHTQKQRSHDLPPNKDASSSASKHKSLGITAMIRPSDNGLLSPVNHKTKKRRYAEKMAIKYPSKVSWHGRVCTYYTREVVMVTRLDDHQDGCLEAVVKMMTLTSNYHILHVNAIV